MKLYALIIALLLLSGCTAMLKDGGFGNAYNAFNDGDYRKAIAKVDRILGQFDYNDYESSELLFLKAEAYRKLGDNAGALGTYSYITKEYPGSVAASKSAIYIPRKKLQRVSTETTTHLNKERRKTSSLGLVPGQSFSSANRTEGKLSKTSKYESKKCDKVIGYIHSDFLTVHEICQQGNGECPKEDEDVRKQVYCVAEYKTECFADQKWGLANPALKFAKSIDYKYMESSRNFREGKWITEACVFW